MAKREKEVIFDGVEMPDKMTINEFDAVVKTVLSKQILPKLKEIADAKLPAEEGKNQIKMVLEDAVRKIVQLAAVNEILLEIVDNNGFGELIVQANQFCAPKKRMTFIKMLAKIFIRNYVIDVVRNFFIILERQRIAEQKKAELEQKAKQPMVDQKVVAKGTMSVSHKEVSPEIVGATNEDPEQKEDNINGVGGA